MLDKSVLKKPDAGSDVFGACPSRTPLYKCEQDATQELPREVAGPDGVGDG